MFTKIKCTDTKSRHLFKTEPVKTVTLKATSVKYKKPRCPMPPTTPLCSEMFFQLHELDLESNVQM